MRETGIHVLVVEDEESIRRLLATTLEAEGYSVSQARDASQWRTLAGNRRIDLFLVDLGLPDGDGLMLIRELRQWTHRPIIVLSARSQERQKVEALDAGADDYLTKPFGVAELHARLRVALRHAAQTSLAGDTRLRFGSVRLDLESRHVERGGEMVRLTATQWRLLEVLAKHAGRVVTSSQLLREVWGPGHAEQGHYLRIYVRQLRQKLEEVPAQPQYLLTETGVGYRLLVDSLDPGEGGESPAGPSRFPGART
ncbi:response regulator [Methylibium rhizosphaerae]|uniref:response regulator n=1 Tax=Methylibium rhizosphaerae TaxID=2570323 RepID=UPI00112999E1|nr:response regulator [Methylibium rhizosphaerae]